MHNAADVQYAANVQFDNKTMHPTEQMWEAKN